jgi:hypothetical protein
MQYNGTIAVHLNAWGNKQGYKYSNINKSWYNDSTITESWHEASWIMESYCKDNRSMVQGQLDHIAKRAGKQNYDTKTINCGITV